MPRATTPRPSRSSSALWRSGRRPWDLNTLAVHYPPHGRYAEAEPLHQRALAIREKALGPEHPHVAQSLENYAALLRQTARADEAERMEARAKAIRAKPE